MSVDIIPDFVRYQIEWLTSHNDLEFEPVIESALVQMLKDTGKSFINEWTAETSQADHTANSGKKVERTDESSQNVKDEDLIQRKATIEAMMFQEIVVRYPSYCSYPEYQGNPYFSIKYTKNGQEFIGYSTYKPEVLSEYLKEYFMPSVQPEIISCFECIHYKPMSNSWGKCYVHSSRTERYRTCQSCDYCSWAERRQDD